jgi:cardiolipin synthase
LLLSTMFITLSLEHQIPWRVTILVFSRDIGILVISAVLYLTAGLRDFRPGFFGKLNTLAQIIVVLAVLVADFHPSLIVVGIRQYGLYATMALTVASAIQYLFLVERRLKALQTPPAE